jgi:RNA polymerase sigma-70 factor (ECF subfamily)
VSKNPDRSAAPPQNPPDRDLIQSYLQGDQKSFGELVLRHEPAISRMVHGHVRQQQDAEDAIQRVFLQAHKHLDKFRGEAQFFTWLYSIALNVIRNHFRQRSLRRMDSIDAPSSLEDESPKQWPDGAPPTDEVVHHRRELERVMTALESVANPHRAIFILHYFQNLTLREVGLRVGRPLGTVKVYLHRARKMVLDRMDSQVHFKELSHFPARPKVLALAAMAS